MPPLILTDEFYAADAAAAGMRLSLPARIAGRLGRLVVSVECFEAAPLPATGRRTRVLDSAEVARVRSEMHARLTESLRRRDLAELLGMSVSDFSRAFHASVGTTFAEYLLRLRLDRAKELMRTTTWSLCDIAIAGGFGDQSNFSRRFARAVGVPPSTWRAMHHRGG